MRWAAAVSEWNKGQIFRDDMYGIPKKGGEFYDEVRDIMGIKTREPKIEEGIKIDAPIFSNPPVEKQMEAVPAPAPASRIQKCPTCGKSYVNLNQHITKMHGDWKAGARKDYEVEYKIYDDDDLAFSGIVKVNGKVVGKFQTESTSSGPDNKVGIDGMTSVNKETGEQYWLTYWTTEKDGVINKNGTIKLYKFSSETSNKEQEIKGAKFVRV